MDRYDLYLFDQFGTLHDGVMPYAGAIDALRGVRVAGKHALIVSNSGRSGSYNRGRMVRLGFPDDVLPPVITSGDCLSPWIEQEHSGARWRIYVTGEFDAELPNCERAGDLQSADLVLFNSFPQPRPAESELVSLLDAALAKRLPMICTNPDETALSGDVSMRAPGSYAREYQRRGGNTTFVGKPYPFIFQQALARHPTIPRSRVIYVGDSLEHDVQGADGAGIDCLWILNGVHRGEFAGMAPVARLSRARSLAVQWGRTPRFFMDELS